MQDRLIPNGSNSEPEAVDGALSSGYRAIPKTDSLGRVTRIKLERITTTVPQANQPGDQPIY